MAERQRNRRSAANSGNSIPQRVENAARSMSDQISSGPRRGYIPPEPGRMPNQQGAPQPGGQANAYPGYYPAQNQQQPYYGGQPMMPGMTGGQRGYIVPPSRQQPKPEKKKNHTLLIIVVILLAAALGTGGYYAYEDYQHTKMINDTVDPYENLFCPGIYVDGIELRGMTWDQALNSVQSQIQQRHDMWKVQLMYNGTQIEEINSDMLQFSVDPTNILYDAWQRGHTGSKEQRYADMQLLQRESYVAYTARPEGNTGIIDETLSRIKAQIDTPAVNAALTGCDWTKIYPFEFSDEAYGFSLDTEPIKQRLYQMVSTMESGTVELVPERLTPAVTKADLMSHYKLRADKYTPIDHHSEENRNNNIRRAFELINGYKLEPGQTFSFNKVVGERTESRGFLEATEYVSDEHVRGIGGGVCQASTTLYQAAVCAGLKIINREHHSDSVSYAPYGTDATVYWFRGGKKIDFSFRNNTDGDIYILSFVQADPDNKKRLIARVIIYGEDMGDIRYEIDTNEVETLPCLLPPKYVADKNDVAKAREGHVVDSFRVEYTNGIETGRVKLSRDTYDPKPEKIYDPSLANR